MPITHADRLRAASKAAANRLNTRHRAETKSAVLARETTAEAVVGHLSVTDRDADILLPGCVRTPPEGVQVSSYNHDSMRPGGPPPVGLARVFERGNQVVAEVRFDASPRGRATCERVQRERPDWSIGYRDVRTRPLTDAERARGAKRAIVSLLIFEISPVSKGAGVATGTFDVCCSSCATSGGKCGPKEPVQDYPPGPEHVAAWQRSLLPKVKLGVALHRESEAKERDRGRQLLARLRDSLDRIEAREDFQ